jgi:uncharacterized lipoprotein YmbA
MRQRSFVFSSAGRAIRSAGTGAALLALAACGSAPPVHLHTLMPLELAKPAGADAAARRDAAPIAFVLAPIRVPAQVDQPQWLVRLPDDSVAALEQERWASPLRDELREALLEELVVGYGAIESRGTSVGGAAPLRVAVDVRRFESMPGREARIEGSWTLAAVDARAPVTRCEWLFREAAPGSLSALGAAHRRAVVRLADSIGAALAASKSGAAPSCPPLDDR